jgi:hypothetical protein
MAEFEDKAAHEKIRVNYTPININNICMIHYGHIREDKYLIDKARIRVEMGDKYLKDDIHDGKHIVENLNWYVDRNKEYEKNIGEVPQNLIEYMKKYE